ncbi:MAG: sialidase family protein [Pirellulaceae bacterium]
MSASVPLAATEPAVEAVDFRSQIVYQSSREPHYAAWASFFPGENGHWYIGCEVVSRPREPLPPTTPDKWYRMGLPTGYDKSQYQMEAVLLESTDDMQTWQEVSREAYRHQHSVHQFASARTKSGRFLRFNWACYSLDPNTKTNEILRVSEDGGRTWTPQPPFCTDRFAYYPHRLRTLRDGTLVLCLPAGPRWGADQEYPLRTAMKLNVNNDMRMSLFFSFDEGKQWQGPVSILDGQNVSETDFVELGDGNLLVFNNSIFASPGRQFIYRDGQRFFPGPLESVRSGTVPETVCLTPDGILVGCMRPGAYFWSDDLGETWSPLSGVGRTQEVYQPWIYSLPDGRIVCAGHFGADDPIGEGRTHANDIRLHTFRLKVNQRTTNTRVRVNRDYDAAAKKWLNRYTLKLTEEDRPLAMQELEFWYVERYQPGYNSRGDEPIEQRMQAGGTLLKTITDEQGNATVQLPERFDKITNPHLSYQFVVRFNMNRADPTRKPYQTPQFEFYAYAPLPPALSR